MKTAQQYRDKIEQEKKIIISTQINIAYNFAQMVKDITLEKYVGKELTMEDMVDITEEIEQYTYELLQEV